MPKFFNRSYRLALRFELTAQYDVVSTEAPARPNGASMLDWMQAAVREFGRSAAPAYLTITK